MSARLLYNDQTARTGMKMVTIIKPLGKMDERVVLHTALAVFSIMGGLIDQVLFVKSLLSGAIWLSFMLSKSFFGRKIWSGCNCCPALQAQHKKDVKSTWGTGI